MTAISIVNAHLADELATKNDELLKTQGDLADRVVGTGEGWLTELDDDALRRLVALDPDAELLDADEGSPEEADPKPPRRKAKEVAR